MGIESVKNSTASYQRAPEAMDVKVETVAVSPAAQQGAADLGARVVTFEKETKSRKPEQEDTAASQTANNEKIKKVVEEINKQNSNSEAIFGIHDATNRVTIKIVDKDTKEVIKEFPPEKTLDMIAKAWEMAGLMVDEKR